ncbi:hypothetical protein O2K51_13430 [Apibacter raozihei]|uniref:hypothetical protein n=1 Tax=Apibacter raozihei TaxID=2500547 RepID=UPI000FE29F46|nr:hypothetical protein [Apibacter raozihei]
MQQNSELRKLKSRIDWFCKSKVNAFSPTISPAPKSAERKEIESIYEAVYYFLRNGVSQLVVQRKYMGSYCDIYLHKNIEDTYFVSRNGFRIEHISKEEALNACKEIYKKLDWSTMELAIIQSELMPWSTLGKGLIENEFRGYLTVHKNHFNELKNSELYHKIEQVKKSEEYKNFISFTSSHSEKEVAKKYPAHIIRQYASVENFTIKNLEAYKQGIDIYEEQIAHFGKTEKMFFKPFNILKKVYEDGTEILVNDNLSYQEVNDDGLLYLEEINEKNVDIIIEEIYAWYKTLNAENEEGIVIKPRKAFIKNIPPAFKIRNDQYLTMIYGVNFLEDYDYYLRKRKIERKLQCSINDWMINWELLKVPYAEIKSDNYYLKNLVYDRIMGEKAEINLDRRL